MSEKIQRLKSRLGQARVAYKTAQAASATARRACLKGVAVALKDKVVLNAVDVRLTILRDDLKENLETLEQYVAETYDPRVMALKKTLLAADEREFRCEETVDDLEARLGG